MSKTLSIFKRKSKTHKPKGKDLHPMDEDSDSEHETESEQPQRARTKSNEVLYVGDKIQLANKRKGKVTSIGPKQDKEGIWVRVLMDTQSHGSPDNMFNENSKKSKAIWVPIQRVDRVLTRGGKFNLTVDDRVIERKKNIPGIIKYVGPTHFDKGVWFGVALDQPKGKNNGTVRKKFYFLTQPNHGVMLPYRRLEPERPVTEEKNPTHDTSRSESISEEEQEPNASKTPSSESDDGPIYPQEPTGPTGPFNPKEKIPFVGWKKLVSDDDEKELEPGMNGVHHDSDMMSPTPSPTPYQLEHDETTMEILNKFMMETKQFDGIEMELYESDLPPITEVSKERREEVFVEKLHLCQAKCDFFDNSDKMIELIGKKESMLLELSEFIARHVWFKEALYETCLKTVSQNLFRALPFQDRPPALSFFNDEVFDKDTNFEDPAWRHLKLVYDLTWRVINTPQVTAAMMEKHMTGEFLGNLVELFASEDHRERAYLMMILHKIYGRCLKLRPYIIDIMSGYFYRMIYNDEFQHVNGIIELLQIICAIIPGLTVPVKDSWQQFVRNILVPLHKCRGLKKFWEQLTQCCVNYVAKDEDGGAVILGGLLKFWPQQSPQKEEIFIMEVVNIINVLITHQHGFSYDNYKKVLVAAANKLTQCMLSTRQPVAERAIAAWKEQSMQRLVDYDRKAFLPKLCEAFYRNREHSNAALKQSSTAVEKIYRSKDSAYWKKMQQYLAKKDKKETAIATAIRDAQMKQKDPYDIVRAKHAKDKSKHKRPKPLTTAEREAKRQHYWKKIRALAEANEEELRRKELRMQDEYSNSSSERPQVGSEPVNDYT